MITKEAAPEVILKEGKPVAVILNINKYQEILEKLEDIEDIKVLNEMRKEPLKFRSLQGFLREYSPSVCDYS